MTRATRSRIPRARHPAIVSGEVLQDSTTANLIFGIDEVIAYASQTTTLEPGDLILTGTPAGVGVFRDPQRLLQRGTRSRSRSTVSRH
jgi:2-keto-4-pentenoate hydratase/2-oxohepta-3-ene-1,7-dioic acid hydratase in catechol pathway